MEAFHTKKILFHDIGEFSRHLRQFCTEAQAFNELHKRFMGVRVIAYSPNAINIQEVFELHHDHIQQDWSTVYFTKSRLPRAHYKKAIDSCIDKRYKMVFEAVYFDYQTPTWC